ncbi:MAG: tetratricopeptide repeat protein [Deltaproteobacteria bacterium]|nr:MAG: tetratricopeptide repeat protein [Deltaproteobacteria bacterium]
MGAVEETKTDEAFLQALYRGSDLLGKGELEAARDSLREALELKPGDPKAKNLYGLACFKLGDYETALKLYQELVHDNPTDATLRVNLGLVHLKSGRFEAAIKELSTATDLDATRRRAWNYLGLAYARVGDYAQARECFAQAGSEQMVARMERALAGEPFEEEEGGPLPAAADASAARRASEPAAAAPQAVEAEAQAVEAAAATEAPHRAEVGPAQVGGEPFRVEVDLVAGDETEEVIVDLEEETDVLLGSEDDGTGADVGEDAAWQSVSAEAVVLAPAQAGPAPGEGTLPSPRPVDAPAPPAPSEWQGPVGLLQAAARAGVETTGDLTFAVGGEVVVVNVGSEVLMRTAGLLAAEGALTFTPEVKRFRGRATDKPYGEGAGRMLRVRGPGRVLLARGEWVWRPLRLDGADGYFMERSVTAFDESLTYENGRVPSPVCEDLNLVHLRGNGSVLLQLPGPLLALDLGPGGPVRVPPARLVGWHGAITPRIVSLADEGGDAGGPLVAVELVGEGVVLLCLSQ